VTLSRGAQRRRALRPAAFAAAALGVLGAGGIAGCGIQSSGLKVVGAAPTVQAANDVTGDGQSDDTGPIEYYLFFYKDGQLVPVKRHTSDQPTEQSVMQALIKGPDTGEQAEGYTTSIPASLVTTSYTANQQQWDYQYSQGLNFQERGQIVCTIVNDLGAPTVGYYVEGKGQLAWNACNDFTTAVDFPPLVSSPTPSDPGSGDSVGSDGSGN
jgi:hypothetical protein